MDRLALALIVIGVVSGLWGVSRSREAGGLQQQAADLDQQVQDAREALAQLRMIRPDPWPLPEAAESLITFARDSQQPTRPFTTIVKLEGSVPMARWTPLRAERLELAFDTTTSPLAATAWLHMMAARHPLVLERVRWDGRRGVIQALIVGR